MTGRFYVRHVGTSRGGDHRRYLIFDRAYCHRIIARYRTADEACAEAAMLNLKHRGA